MNHEVITWLRIRDEATAVLQRYISVLREAQEQVDATMVGLKELRSAMAPSTQQLAAQREALSMTSREGEIRAAIGAETLKQNQAIVAARERSLELAKAELATQRQTVTASLGGGHGSNWRGAANHLGNDMMLGGAGILGAAAYATQKAMDFNQTALETDIALGGYNRSGAQRQRDIRSLQRAAMAGSEATGFFDAQQILEGLKVAASAGARPLVEKMGMKTFTAIAPALSRYMDVLGRLKGEAPDTAAIEALQTSHQFGAYTPDAINRILNAQAALALLMPDKMSTAVTTGAYVAPTGISLAGIPQEAILAFMATADQTGLGRGRAGARLKDYIEAIAVRQSKAREHAKSELGVRAAIDAHGDMDLMKSFEILGADAKRMRPQEFRDLVRTAFGAPGSVVAAIFGDPKKQAMFEANRSVIEGAIQHGDLKTIQDLLKITPSGAEATMIARLNNDIIHFGQFGLPIAVKFFDTINPKLKQFGDWLDQHPKDASKLFNDIMHVGEGLLILGGTLKALAIIAGTIRSIQALTTAVLGVRTAATAAGPALASVAGGIRALTSAGGAFLASPFGKIISGAGVFFGTTSFMPQDLARKDLVKQYGYEYYRYLKGRHPGTNPYSFDSGGGDLTPDEFNRGGGRYAHPSAGAVNKFNRLMRPLSPPTPVHASATTRGGSTVIHNSISKVEINLPHVTDPKQAARAIDAVFQDPRHWLQVHRGGTHKYVPIALSVEPA